MFGSGNFLEQLLSLFGDLGGAGGLGEIFSQMCSVFTELLGGLFGGLGGGGGA